MLSGFRSSKLRPAASHPFLISLRSSRISSIKMLDPTQTLRSFGRRSSFSASSFEKVLPPFGARPTITPRILIDDGTKSMPRQTISRLYTTVFLSSKPVFQTRCNFFPLSQLSLASPNFGLIAHEKCIGCDLSPERPCASTDLET